MGDKAKWFAHELQPVRFSAFAPPCDPGGCDKWNMPGLASVLRGLREHHLAADQEPATDESGSDSEAISTSSSCSSLRSLFIFGRGLKYEHGALRYWRLVPGYRVK